jgi:hypothetical protein
MATVYHLPRDGVNAVEPPPSSVISGTFLSHNRYDLVGKAFLGADLHRGARLLRNPTIVQAAMLARVNRCYVDWAVKRYALRAQIEKGQLSLVPPPAKEATKALDVELANMIRKVGVAHALDVAAMVDAAE